PASPRTALFPYTTLFRSGQVPVGREGPAVRFEPKGFRRLDARFLQGLDCFRLGRVDLHLRLRDRFLDSLRLQQSLLAAVVRGLRSEEHTSELQSRVDLVC